MKLEVILILSIFVAVQGLANDLFQVGSRTEGEAKPNELGDEVSTTLNRILDKYDKRVRPNYGGEPVVVKVTMFVLSISSISEVQMDYTMDMYFRQSWKDPRLQFKGPPGISNISMGSEVLRRLWVPDTFFVNEKASYFHTATIANEFVRISEDGDVLRSMRLTVTASCPMDLRYYPMDRQLCTLEIESFGHTMSDIEYTWEKGPNSIGVSSDVGLPQFEVARHRTQRIVISLRTGNYSRLASELLFVRSQGYYLLQIYFPSIMIVLISWVSFWLNRSSATARTVLGVTTVLTMATLMSSTNAALPKISYLKSIDIYLGICFLMVFLALLEYALVVYLAKRIQLRKSRSGTNRNGNGDDPNLEDPEGSLKLVGSPDKLYGLSPSDVDKYSRILFPFAFVVFQLTYWLVYLHLSKETESDMVHLR